MSLRVRNEGLLALFAFLSKDSFAKSKLKMIDFSVFRKTAVFYSQKKNGGEKKRLETRR